MNASLSDASSPRQFPLPLICPICRARLVEDERRLTCGSCGREWSRQGKITNLCDEERYWGEVSPSLMKEVFSAAERLGWREAIRLTLAESHPDVYWYVVSETRADFRFLLPTDPQSVVLEAGAGWGSLALPLARVCRWVVALDCVTDRIRFAELRAFQEGIRNLQLTVADIQHPPFLPGQFDIIVANGLLEWVGLSAPNSDPRDAQIAFLKRMRELLRPGGVIYIGVDNRFGIGQWRGDLDHSGLRYTSLMPRRLADPYTRMRQQRGHGLDYRFYRVPPGYRTYTYSLAGYRELLRESGFPEVEAYTGVPGFSKPHQVVPLEDDGVLRYYLDYMVRPQSALVRLCRSIGRELWWPIEMRMRRFLAPSILLVAHPAEEGEGTAE